MSNNHATAYMLCYLDFLHISVLQTPNRRAYSFLLITPQIFSSLHLQTAHNLVPMLEHFSDASSLYQFLYHCSEKTPDKTDWMCERFNRYLRYKGLILAQFQRVHHSEEGISQRSSSICACRRLWGLSYATDQNAEKRPEWGAGYPSKTYS